ncbi:hypothetical protein [Mucilaginibacter pineti]|nr:hypothetical protein [Mucilaginibacter pineti]
MNEVIKFFKSHGKGFAITNTPGRRDILHMKLTTPHAFIRFSASGDKAIDKQRLDFGMTK